MPQPLALRFRAPRLSSLVFLFTALSAFLLAFPRPAQSQVLLALIFGDKIASEKFHLGIDVGAQFSDQASLGGDKARTTLAAGVTADYKLSSRFYLYGEVMGLSKMGSNGFAPAPTGNPDLDTFLSGSEMAVQLSYISVPVILKYGFADNRLLVGAGGQIGFLTGAQNYYSGTASGVGEYTYSQDIKDDYNSVDGGLAFLLEYILHARFRPSIQLQGYLGLTDVIRDNTGDAVTNRTLTLSLVIPLLGHGTSEEGGSGSSTSGTTSSSSKR